MPDRSPALKQNDIPGTQARLKTVIKAVVLWKCLKVWTESYVENKMAFYPKLKKISKLKYNRSKWNIKKSYWKKK